MAWFAILSPVDYFDSAITGRKRGSRDVRLASWTKRQICFPYQGGRRAEIERQGIEENSSWEVCGEAENGEIAVERVKELHPDVVILDLQMPVMDGLEAARQISHMAPKTAMMMFTAFDGDPLLRDARDAGIEQVFSKFDGLATHLLASLEDLRLRTEPGAGSD